MTPTVETTGPLNVATGTGLRAGRRRWRWWASAGALALLGAGALLASTRRVNDPEVVWRRAVEDLRGKRLGRAEAALRELERLRSSKAKDWLLRAEVAAAKGRTAQALAALDRVPDSDPMASEARSRAGSLELARAHARAAEAQWSRSLALDPNRIEVRRSLSYLYAVQLRKAEFNAQFREIALRVPATYALAYFRSQINCAIYDPSEAAAQLERFVEADPEDRVSRLALFEVELKRDRVADAERLLANLPEGDLDARAARARVALLKGDEDRLESLLNSAPEEHPGLARVRGRRALARREFADAARHYLAVLAVDPEDHDALQGLARALRMSGDENGSRPYQERLRVLERLWELVQRASKLRAPDDPELIRSLGRACEAANRPEEARAWFSLLIDRDPLDADAQRALHRLSASYPL